LLRAASPVTGPHYHPCERPCLCLFTAHGTIAPDPHVIPCALAPPQVFSKLAAGRLPTRLELLEGLVAALGPAPALAY
jgi:hypothetical protein